MILISYVPSVILSLRLKLLFFGANKHVVYYQNHDYFYLVMVDGNTMDYLYLKCVLWTLQSKSTGTN